MSSRQAEIEELKRQIRIAELEKEIAAAETQRIQRERQQVAQMQVNPPQTTHQPSYMPYYPSYTAIPSQQVNQTPNIYPRSLKKLAI